MIKYHKKINPFNYPKSSLLFPLRLSVPFCHILLQYLRNCYFSLSFPEFEGLKLPFQNDLTLPHTLSVTILRNPLILSAHKKFLALPVSRNVAFSLEVSSTFPKARNLPLIIARNITLCAVWYFTFSIFLNLPFFHPYLCIILLPQVHIHFLE